jgi:broad specificity phosphatase PhoE
MADTGFSLVFETHSTSLDNEAGLASGWSDVDLSSTGEEQARQLGVRRAGEPFAAVFCSDLKRAFRTGEIAFGQRGASIVRDARLRECNYGVLTRSPASRIEAIAQRAFADRPGTCPVYRLFAK